ncbi:transmembrane protein 70, mitochondrial [Stigmatopora argus]
MFSFNCVFKARVGFIANSLSVSCRASGLGQPKGNPLHTVRRSPLSLKIKLHSLTPRSYLSTGAHPEQETLIYKGSLAAAVRGVKFFSYSTSGASLFLMPQILLKTGIGVQSLALQVAFCGTVAFFTFLTPALLHFLTKGYVVRLYHDSERDTYTAVTYSIFLTEQRTVFHQKQVSVPAVSKMFTTFYADNTGMLVNPDMFSLPRDYNHLMGYDKPFTLKAEYMDRP